MKKFLQRIMTRLRQRYCSHEVYYMETMRRRADGNVEAPCDRCGKMLVAEYGLALPAVLRQRGPRP